MIEFDPSLKIPHEVWEFVLDRDGWMCQNSDCWNVKRGWSRYDNLTLHHIIPRSQGGLGSDPCNLITLCWACHDKVEIWKHVRFDLCVVDPKKLIHREPLAFYDHHFKPGHIICSHESITKKTPEETQEREAETREAQQALASV